MNWLARIFAHAIARRVAYVLVALLGAALVSLFGMGEARADEHATIQQASNHCEEAAASARERNPNRSPFCEHTPPQGATPGFFYCFMEADVPCRYFAYGNFKAERHYYLSGCQGGASWDENIKFCNDCSNRPSMGAGAWSGANSEDQICLDNCVFQGGSGGGAVGVCMGIVIDKKPYTQCTSWGPTGASCAASGSAPGLAPPDSDGDGTSDPKDPAPNNPGSGGGGGGGDDGDEAPPEDGSSACGGEGQPECAADGSNAGSGRGNTSGGGGDCNTPPSSTGDAILAQIAFQTWATRCAIVATANAGPGGGTGGGVGTGDGDGAKEGTLKGIKDFLDGNGEGIGDPEDPWMDGLPGEGSDWSLGLGSGSCPAPVSTVVTLGGVSAPIEFSFQPLCDLAGLLRTVFMALGALIAAYIVAGVRR